jgi:hypothetical protein
LRKVAEWRLIAGNENIVRCLSKEIVRFLHKEIFDYSPRE